MISKFNLGSAVLISILLLVPCFWQQRIQAGDLSSHIYNSWLAQQVEQGKAPGLAIGAQSTNVLFDLILGRLFETFGANAAQRIAVSGAVLIFFWGAFRLICMVSGETPWFLTPCLAMLAYGWTFHSGLFNYYLSAGLSLWALALFWTGGWARIAGGVILMALTYVAHAVGFAWAIGVIVYALIHRGVPERFRPALLVVALGAVAGLRFSIVSRYQTFWSPHQVLEASGTDQVWTFGLKYCAVSILLGLLWSFLFLRLSHEQSAIRIVKGLPFQLCLIMSTAVLLIPTRIEIPGYNAALSFITERLTLLLGVLICGFLASSKPARGQSISLAVLAAVYFSFLWVDTRSLNAAENRIESALAAVPPGQRVFGSFSGEVERVLLWPHATDRACIGRCFSYNNYEPNSGAFRVRAIAENRFVVPTPPEHYALRYGGYVVRAQDLPLYQLQPCAAAGDSFCAIALKAGDVTKSYPLSLLPLLW